jgi:hypothetical protein
VRNLHATSASQVSLRGRRCQAMKRGGEESREAISLCPVQLVVSWHDELTTHFIKFVPTHMLGAVRRIGIGAHSDAELVVALESQVSSVFP